MKSIGLLILGKKGIVTLRELEKFNLLNAINFVVIGFDKSIQNDYSVEAIQFCSANKINWLKREDYIESQHKCDFIVAIGWRWLLNLKNNKLITIHDSLLPKYRGFNPLVTALIEGDKVIGATAILANNEVDSGDIITNESIEIQYPIKIEKAIDEVANLYGKILVRILKSAFLKPKPQNHSFATYSVWRNEDDYKIDWSWDAQKIARFVDAVGYPYLGAVTDYNGYSIRVKEVSVEKDLNIINRTNGKILKIDQNQPIIICGKGLIRIKLAITSAEQNEFKFDKLRVRLK